MDMQTANTMPIEAAEVAPEVAPVAASSAAEAAPIQANWFDSIKEKLNTQEAWATELVIFGLSGLIIGFLLKNFGKILVTLTLAALAIAVVLHFTVYPMPMDKLQAFFGIADFSDIQGMINAKIAWIKQHPVAAVSGFVGILVGWKVG